MESLSSSSMYRIAIYEADLEEIDLVVLFYDSVLGLKFKASSEVFMN